MYYSNSYDGTTTAAGATTSDTAVQVTLSDSAGAAAGSHVTFDKLVIINTGAAGFFKIGGGVYCYMAAASAVEIEQASISSTIYIKRIPSGTDLSGVYVWGYSR